MWARPASARRTYRPPTVVDIICSKPGKWARVTVGSNLRANAVEADARSNPQRVGHRSCMSCVSESAVLPPPSSRLSSLSPLAAA